MRTSLSPDIVLRTRRRRQSPADEGDSGDDEGGDGIDAQEAEDGGLDVGHRAAQGNDHPILLLLAMYLTMALCVVVARYYSICFAPTRTSHILITAACRRQA